MSRSNREISIFLHAPPKFTQERHRQTFKSTAADFWLRLRSETGDMARPILFAMRYLNAERAQLSSPNEWDKSAVSRTKPNSNQIVATIDICAVEKWRNCTLRSIFRARVFHENVKIESSVDCWTRRRARNFMNRFCNFKCRRVIACCTFCSCIAWNWIDHKFSCIVLKVRVNPIIQLQHHHHRSASARSTRLRWLKLNRTTTPNWNLFNSRQESNDRAIFLMFLTAV